MVRLLPRPQPSIGLGQQTEGTNMNVKIADRIKMLVVIVTALIMVYALYVSKDHITHVAHFIGIPGWQAATAFILIDLPALIGKLMGLKYFSATTRKAGRQMTYFSGSISLICNVASGLILGSFGAAGWGAFVVMMFLYLESRITKIKPASSVTRAKNAANGEAPVKVSKGKAAKPTHPLKGVGWSPERRAAFEAKRAERELEEAYAGPSAPVSGI